MAGEVKIEIEGLEELQKALKKFPKATAKYLAAAGEEAAETDRAPLSLELGDGQIEHVLHDAPVDVVDRNGDGSETFGIGEQAFHAGLIGGIDREGARFHALAFELLHERGQPLCIARAERKVETLRSELAGERCTEAAPRSDDDGGLMGHFNFLPTEPHPELVEG